MTIKSTIHFNTGRPYSAKHGQRITATQFVDGVVTFHDHDRMIYGELYGAPRFTATDVLRAYDNGDWKQSMRADFVATRGSNASYGEPAP